MSKRKRFKGKNTKLSDKAEQKQQSQSSGIVDADTQQPKKRVNFTLAPNDVQWLDTAVKQYNRDHVRKINKSELIRVLINYAREEGIEDVIN